MMVLVASSGLSIMFQTLSVVIVAAAVDKASISR